MPIHLNNRNGTQIYHREGDMTSKFSIFGSGIHSNKINYGYVTVEDVPRNNHGFFTARDKRPSSYYEEGIIQSKTNIQAPVWALVETDQKLTPQNNAQLTNGEHVLLGEETKNYNKRKFIWPYGGNNVYLTGTFDHWQTSIPMTPVSGTGVNDRVFEATVDNLDLSKDITYKFVVDGEWCYDIKKDFVVDASGNVNNIIYAEV